MRQKFGQNFLIDKNIAGKIVDAASVSDKESVLEIGPGRGILTEIIAPLAKDFIAVELDKKLSENLTKRFSRFKNLEIINHDFLKYSIPENKNFTIIANLPYYVSTAILHKFLPGPNWKKAVIMVQKEVGQRITADPGSKAYGAFSVYCRYFADIELLFYVNPKSFYPVPKVDSCVLLFSNKYPPSPDKDLFNVVNLSFQQRRKTIINSLSGAMKSPKSQFIEVFRKANIDPALRPENLTIDNFLDLTLALRYCRILS